MSIKVQDALKAREEKRKNNNVDSAIEAYKKRKQLSTQSATADIVERINAEIEKIKAESTPYWGTDALGNTLDDTRESRLNVEKLQREVESYKNYLDTDTYNSFSSTIAAINKAYDSQIEGAKLRSQFETEDAYNEWKKFYDWSKSILEAEDFLEKSQYVSTYRGGEEFNALAGMYTDTGYEDIMYDYINRDKRAIDRQALSDLQSNAAILGLDNSERKEMSDDEIKIFNYLYATQGSDMAYAYIKKLTSDLNRRQREAQMAQWAKFADESPVGASIFSVLSSPLKGLSYLGQLADYVEDGKIYVETSAVASIRINTGTRFAKRVYNENCTPVTRVVFELPMEKNPYYFRITATDMGGKSAYSNAYFLDELE